MSPSGSILLLAILAAVLPAQSTLPPIPRLALETFPAAARDAVSKQYKEVAARPADAGAMGALGRILHAWEQWDSAHQAYERAAALAASDFDWTYLDAIVLQRLARYDAAATALRRALDVRPDFLPARLRLAEVLLDAGDLAQSEKLFVPLAAIAATGPAAEVGLGRINAARGHNEEAIGLRRRIAQGLLVREGDRGFIGPSHVHEWKCMCGRFYATNIDLFELFDVAQHSL